MTSSWFRHDTVTVALFAAAVLSAPAWLLPFGAAYPDILQKFAIYGLFAIGFNILFGLTGYLSFGHAAFLGIGSYTAVWSFKLLTMNVLPAVLLAMLMSGVVSLLVGYICLRRSGIYFSILTLAFAQMAYNLAYSALTPITNGETGLKLSGDDPRVLDALAGRVASPGGGLPQPDLFGLGMQGYSGAWFCGIALILAFLVALRIRNSAFGLVLLAMKSNQNRLGYTGVSPRPHALAAFVISGMYAGLAGALLVVTDPLAGAERMQWTASGEVVLMTILGGSGSLTGPLLGAVLVKYAENIFSAYNAATIHQALSFLPDPVISPVAAVLGVFVGDGWSLTLGILFVAVVVFLPGGLIQGVAHLRQAVIRLPGGTDRPAENRQ